MGSADDRFREMFFEEARDLLHILEEGLLELERRQEDRAHLDKIFRAAHSIKGAAAMVGLTAIADFTHGMEAVLDKVRNRTLTIDTDVIETLLNAKDHLAAAVESDAAGSPIPAPAELVERLAQLLRDPNAAPTPTKKAGPATPAAPESTAKPEPARPAERPARAASAPAKKPRSTHSADTKARPRSGGSRGKKAAKSATKPAPTPAPGKLGYRITFAPGPDTLKRGIDPLGILDELRDLGEATVVTDPESIPPLEEMDPERSYLTWIIDLETTARPDQLDEVFLFVAEDSKITIELRDSTGAIVPPGDEFLDAVVAVPAASARGPLTPPEPEKIAAAARAAEARAAEAAKPAAATETPAATEAPTPGSAKPPAPAATATVKAPTRIRVDAHQLDDLVGLAGELAVLSDNLQGVREIAGVERWVATLEALDRVSRLIRDTTLELRMVPVEELFSRFPRVVRDLAERTGKDIDLQIIGQDTRLDRTIVEALNEPMIHLIRNAVDHGLEVPSERVAAGKSPKGRLTLWAGHEGDRVALRIEEDGRGLDRERIVRKGIARGLVPVGTSADDPRVDSLIFEPGFSTRDEVSAISGRGVGLDVVRDAVRSLRGSLSVESTPGKGTCFIFRLPLTLALIDGLLVETAGSRYVVPLAQVEECVALSGHSQPALSKGRPCVSVRGELVPMVPLRGVFHVPGSPPSRQELLLTRHAGQRVGVAVDRLLGRVQAVIQSLGSGLTSLGRFSGATILGDGSVSLILDLAALVAESRAADSSMNSRPSHPTA